MLNSAINRIWTGKPKLSIVFWLCFLLVYVIGTLAILSILIPDLDAVVENESFGTGVAFKLSSIRVTIILITMTTFPILLWKKRDVALTFLKVTTAWAVTMYIDDYLILYDIVKHPDLTIVKIVFALRPFVITALAWMCLELHFRAKNGY